MIIYKFENIDWLQKYYNVAIAQPADGALDLRPIYHNVNWT